jgi:hypothetical protein
MGGRPSVASVVRFHRALLIAATVGVAVAASRVAFDLSEIGGWLLVAAFGLLLLVADLAREIEEAAGALADKSGVDRGTARRDIYRSRHPRALLAALVAAVLLIGGAGAVYAVAHLDNDKKPAAPMRPHPRVLPRIKT